MQKFHSDSNNAHYRPAADSAGQRKGRSEQNVGFVDNRAGTVMQNTLRDAMHTAPGGISGFPSQTQVAQLQVIDTRAGKSGYWDAKKIRTKNMGTGWWQFRKGANQPITNEFQTNDIGPRTYEGGDIQQSDYGVNPVIASTDVESKRHSGYMRMANNTYKKLSQVSDGAVFAAASRKVGMDYQGTGYTWHHGDVLGTMYLLDTKIHSAFAPHVGWASKGGSRNEMSDFIVYDY